MTHLRAAGALPLVRGGGRREGGEEKRMSAITWIFVYIGAGQVATWIMRFVDWMEGDR